jgi:hypothetical protein
MKRSLLKQDWSGFAGKRCEGRGSQWAPYGSQGGRDRVAGKRDASEDVGGLEERLDEGSWPRLLLVKLRAQKKTMRAVVAVVVEEQKAKRSFEAHRCRNS